MKAGFIGLGNLGSAMAGRLKQQGVELVVYNRTRSKAEALGAAKVASSPAEVHSECEITFINLFDSAAVEDVLLGSGGIVDGDGDDGKVIVDTTTNHFESAAYFHDIMQEYGDFYIEAPVLGSVVPASKGALTVVAGGDTAAFKRARPLLEMIGSNIFHVGEEPGLASKMKLINNLVLGSLMASISEAVSLAESSGISKETALDVLSNGAGKSLVMDAKRQKLLSEDFSTHFSTALIYKDLHCLQDLAYSMKRPLFTAAGAMELFGMAYRDGLADEDFSAVYKVLKKFGG